RTANGLFLLALRTSSGVCGPAFSTACSYSPYTADLARFLHSTLKPNSLRAAGDKRTSSPLAPIDVLRTSSGSSCGKRAKILSLTYCCNLLPLFLADCGFICQSFNPTYHLYPLP